MKVGDRVRIKTGVYAGHSGEVSAIYPDNETAMISCKHFLGGSIWIEKLMVRVEQLSAGPTRAPRTNFKVGDEVYIPAEPFRGSGRITRISSDETWPITVNFIEGDCDCIYAITDCVLAQPALRAPVDELVNVCKEAFGETFIAALGISDAAAEPGCDCGGLKTYRMISKETCAHWCGSQK